MFQPSVISVPLEPCSQCFSPVNLPGIKAMKEFEVSQCWECFLIRAFLLCFKV